MLIEKISFLKYASFGVITLLPLSCSNEEAKTVGNELPNIVLIYADDLAWNGIGYNGAEYYETPNIDKLAAQGMIFTNAYANAPFCSPSRACMLSGLYTPRHDIYIPGKILRGDQRSRKFIPPENKYNMDTSIVTLAEMLKTKGYVSACIGKYHVGVDDYAPKHQGFDVELGGCYGKTPTYFYPYQNADGTYGIFDLPNGKEGEYLTDRLTKEALNFIDSNKEAPFFLYLAHYAPHTPIEAKQELIEKYKDKDSSGQRENPTYAAMIESLDKSVGRVLAKVEELGITENTVFIFYSDNGGYNLVTNNAPLRGSKGTIYEGGIRVPLTIKWPGKIEPGSMCDVPVTGTDFYPTFMDMVGAEKKSFFTDGTSFYDLLFDPELKTERPALFWYVPCYLPAYDSAKYKRDNVTHLIKLTSYGRIKQDSSVQSHPSHTYPSWRTTPVNAIRKGKYKLVEFFEREELELYDLENDLGETTNLAEKMPELTRQLYDTLKYYRKKTGADFPLEKNPAYDPSYFTTYPVK